MITRSTDAYHASRTSAHNGHKVIRYMGVTPVEWVHDDNFGIGFSLEGARKVLDGYYREDVDRSGKEGFEHRHFDMTYTSDVDIYRIKEMEE